MKKSFKYILLSLAPVTISITTSLSSCGAKPTPIPTTPVVHKNQYYKVPAIADTITVFDPCMFNELEGDMRVALESLEGITAQTKAEIFVKSGTPQRDRWLYEMQKENHFKIKYLVNPEDIWSEIKQYVNSGLLQGYVSYKKAEPKPDQYSSIIKNDKIDNISINNACMVSACDHCIMFSDELLDKYANKIHEIGLRKNIKWDAENASPIETLNHYSNQLNKKMILCQQPLEYGLRDYAIASKMPTICIGLLSDEDKQIVADYMDDNASMFGWAYGWSEQDYLWWATENKLPVLASDHDANLSLYSYKKVDFAYKQKHNRPKLKADPNKHYVCIVMSDGDNIQWMQDDFLSSPEYWGSPYRGQIPITWTISPSVIDLNASILDELYATASDNDQLIAGPSGYAYINPAFFYQDGLKDQYNQFANTTFDYMKDTDLEYINPLDFQRPGDYGAVPDVECLKPLLNNDQVKGLVWAVTDLSLSGHGSIDWINDKPILSFREGFWDWHEELTNEQAAKRINSYPRDPSRIDGYTAITSCVWSKYGKMNAINDFVQMLDDDVEIVTLDQMLQLITDNVPHVHAVPEQHAPWGK